MSVSDVLYSLEIDDLDIQEEEALTVSQDQKTTAISY
jgi:hypothetical protein